MGYEYTITIKQESSKQNGLVNPSNMDPDKGGLTPTTPKQADGNNHSSTSGLVKALIVSEGKRYAKYAASNVGKYAADNSVQTKVNNGIEGAGLLVGAVVNPYLTAAATAFSFVKTFADGMFDRRQEKNRIEAARTRNGYTDLESITTSRRH